MKFIADLHIHSHFSIATSKELIPEYLDYWARLKGITVVGTGDFTHPGWVEELKVKLEPAETGLFKLKDSYKIKTDVLGGAEVPVRFMLTSEVSNIYKKAGHVRKVHNVIFAPDFAAVEKIQESLIRIGGNITSDGRPILGLDSRDLLEIALDASENIFFVPAHIWTPWFSALGSKSGFDSIAECYSDLSEHIHAVETGLSTDPPMNWLCSHLDAYTLMSNSDAHSPDRLGRNANFFNAELDYFDMIDALKAGDPDRFIGTIDLFPQEGKYHYDGHRKCNICWNPLQTLEHDHICPVCGKKVTVGVMYRVAELADRDNPLKRPNRLKFFSIIPLKEILSEIYECGPNTKKVTAEYHSLIKKTGSEFNVLLHMPVADIEHAGDALLAEGIRRMRNRQVCIKEGYDGEYGVVKVFKEGEKELLQPRGMMFSMPGTIEPPHERALITFDSREFKRVLEGKVDNEHGRSDSRVAEKQQTIYATRDNIFGLNREQLQAATHGKGAALIIAGPGSGKTRTLACRVAYLIREQRVEPSSILAVTFTNKAAREMRNRINTIIEDTSLVNAVNIFTFHGLGLEILKQHLERCHRTEGFSLIDEEARKVLLREMGVPSAEGRKVAASITRAKQHLYGVRGFEAKDFPIDADEDFEHTFTEYESYLRTHNAFDLDDLIYQLVRLFGDYPDLRELYRQRFRWIMVDEYQDVNFAQYQLIRLLMPDSDANLCVIGDPNQAIYGFRGANVRFIQQFVDDYPGAAVFHLIRSYRCSDHILRASQGVIVSVQDGTDKIIRGLNSGVKIKIVENATDKSEAEFVARSIEQMIGGLRFFSMDSDISEGEQNEIISSLSDFAVLVRTSRQMGALEKAFHDHSIPYQVVGETPFFKTEPVKSIIDVVNLAANPGNLWLVSHLIHNGILKKSSDVEPLKTLVKGASVKEMILRVKERVPIVIEMEYEPSFRRLLSMAEEFGHDIQRFLEHTMLGIAADGYVSETESVVLMTLHAAKGLEFPCVFITGCEDRLIPYGLFKSTETDLNEERRLLYVGMTRAKEMLFLTYARKRFLHGKEFHFKRSPFVDRIERSLIEQSKTRTHKKSTNDAIQLDMF